jgi:hypothetical protein
MHLKYRLWKNAMTTGIETTVERGTAREEVGDEQKPGFIRELETGRTCINDNKEPIRMWRQSCSCLLGF